MAKTLLHNKRNKIRMTVEDKIYQAVIYTIVTLFTLMCLMPLIYVIGVSLSSYRELIEKRNFVLIPEHPTLEGYEYVLKQANFKTGFIVSVARTLLGVVAALTFIIPGGYILSKYEMPGRKWIMLFFIITMLIGGGTIPGYMLIKDLGLLDSFWVYIVPAFGGTYNMLIVKIFCEGTPKDIVESADLDGATEWQKMVHIFVPLLVPTLCALGLFAAVGHWNAWFDAMLYVKTPAKQPVQYLIHQLFQRTVERTSGQDMNMLVEELYRAGTDLTVKMACVVVAMVPILCVYPFLQKYFIFGMYTGSVKG